VLGVDGSEGLGERSSLISLGEVVYTVGWRTPVEGAVSMSVSISEVSDMGESGPILLRSPGDSAPGAVLERFSGRGRWSRLRFGDGVVLSGGNK
jgi:hypothetical protein